jgi:hypothetical protein
MFLLFILPPPTISLERPGHAVLLPAMKKTGVAGTAITAAASGNPANLEGEDSTTSTVATSKGQVPSIFRPLVTQGLAVFNL